MLSSLDKRDRSIIYLPSVHKVQNTAEAHQPHEEDGSPIEVGCNNVVRVGPEAPEEGPARINQCDTVDG